MADHHLERLLGLEGVGAVVTRPNPDGVLNRQDENLPIAELTGLIGFDDGLHERLHVRVFHDPRDHPLGQIPDAHPGRRPFARQIPQATLAAASEDPCVRERLHPQPLDPELRLAPPLGPDDRHHLFQPNLSMLQHKRRSL